MSTPSKREAARAEPPPVESPGTVNLLDYWKILVRRRTAVLACFAAVVLVSGLLTVFATGEYEAVATVQIERQGPDILSFTDVLSADSAGYRDFYETQYRILRSRAVLRIAAERIDLARRPDFVQRKRSPIARMYGAVASVFSADGADEASSGERALSFLERNLSVRPVPKSHLVEIAFAHRSPELARDAANAVVAAYQQFNLEARHSTTAQASEFLTKQVAQLETEISGMERRLQEYGAAKEILVFGVDGEDIDSRALADFNARLVDVTGRLALAEARYLSVLQAEPEGLPEVLNSPLIARLKQQRAEIEREHSQMAQRFMPDWPTLRQLREELDKASEQLETEVAAIASQVRSVGEADHRRALAEVENLSRRVEGQKTKVHKVNRDEIEYASLAAQIENKRSFLNELLGRQSQSQVSDQLQTAQASNVRVVDLAETPRKPIRPRKALNMMLACLLGLMLGVGVACLVEHLDYSIKDEDDVRRLSGLPVLGHISLFRPLRPVPDDDKKEATAPNPSDVASHVDPRSGFAETFRNLRTSILFASPDRPPRHIVITSCEPGDGKSTVSVNLAIVLSQLGRRVLLVDADLRRPRIHKMLQLPNHAGLSSLLTGNAELEDLFQCADVPNLRIVTSGPIPPTPSELLGSPSLQSLLDRLADKEHFEHVIFDTAPSLGVPDGVILASRSDATILVARAGKTARDSVSQASGRLFHARAHVVGAVLNGVPEQTGHYYGRYFSYSSDEPASEPETSGRRASKSATKLGSEVSLR